MKQYIQNFTGEIEVIKNFKFEINCLNLFETPCSREYGAVTHKIGVLVRTLHVRWESRIILKWTIQK
jgi:hypothetical protein